MLVRNKLINQKFNKLLVLSFSHVEKKRLMWNCVCDCGNSRVVCTTDLRNGAIWCCGCQNDFGYDINVTLELQQQALMRRLFSNYKSNAKSRQLCWSLSFAQYHDLVTKNCHYCGSSPKLVKKLHFKGFVYAHGIDRINNNIGYKLDNCVPCCKICNFAKGNMLSVEFLTWLDNLVKYRSKL